MNEIKLTQFSPGAGCGCKISSGDLESILHNLPAGKAFSQLLVGYETKDDAAVYDIGNGQALISTTDFFTPIVDDPVDYGRIAAANALSDVYAMGGSPLMAISVLGWPIEKLSADTAGKVIEGARYTCDVAGIPLAGGHSIDISDPVFGLAVTGIAPASVIKRNCTAMPEGRLFISKPVGTGILSTAGKKGFLSDEDYRMSVHWMTRLNSLGTELGKLEPVRAMTDITGYGLLGHLLEICEGSGISAVIEVDKVPFMDNLHLYIEKNCIPGGTYRNWKSYGSKIGDLDEIQKLILADPQTSGGLLIATDPQPGNDFLTLAEKHNLVEIGYLADREPEAPVIIVR